MKIIELLKKIANGEEVPKKIKWRNKIYKYNVRWNDYKNEVDEVYFFQTILSRNCDMLLILNDEVEIISEEKKIEFEDIESFGIHYSWNYIDYKNIEELKKYVNKDFQNIFDTLDKLIKNQKKIIDVINDRRDKEC